MLSTEEGAGGAHRLRVQAWPGRRCRARGAGSAAAGSQSGSCVGTTAPGLRQPAQQLPGTGSAGAQRQREARSEQQALCSAALAAMRTLGLSAACMSCASCPAVCTASAHAGGAACSWKQLHVATRAAQTCAPPGSGRSASSTVGRPPASQAASIWSCSCICTALLGLTQTHMRQRGPQHARLLCCRWAAGVEKTHSKLFGTPDWSAAGCEACRGPHRHAGSSLPGSCAQLKGQASCTGMPPRAGLPGSTARQGTSPQAPPPR